MRKITHVMWGRICEINQSENLPETRSARISGRKHTFRGFVGNPRAFASKCAETYFLEIHEAFYGWGAHGQASLGQTLV